MSQHERLQQIDLRSLRILSLLLRHQNTTKVAEILGITQANVSYHLGKLRQQLDDPLLIATGKTMHLTERATELSRTLGDILEQLEWTLFEAEVDLVQVKRVIRIAILDYPASRILPQLLAKLAQEAPGVTIEQCEWNPNVREQLERGEIDIAVNPMSRLSANIHGYELGKIAIGVLMRKGHPLATLAPEQLIEQVFDFPHVRLSSSESIETEVDKIARELGVERHFALKTSNFSVMAECIAQNDCVGLITDRIADGLASERAMEMRLLPMGSKQTVYCYWHSRSHQDKLHQFIRRAIIEIMTQTNEKSRPK